MYYGTLDSGCAGSKEFFNNAENASGFFAISGGVIWVFSLNISEKAR